VLNHQNEEKKKAGEAPRSHQPLDTDKDLGFHTGLQTGSFPSASKPLEIASHTSPTSWMCTVHNCDVPALLLIQFQSHLIWRTKNQARDQDTVELQDSICFNQSKLVPRNWTLDPRLKRPLVIICQRKEVSCKGYTASVAHHRTLAVYHQLSLKSMEIPYVSVLYNQLKTDHLALIPFNLGAKGYTAALPTPGPWQLTTNFH